jgi:oligoendopeptidase F
MAMELLASPYLTAEQGGFYTPVEAARARLEHLERSLLFWPYMAVVDAFQHWAYTHPEGGDPERLAGRSRGSPLAFGQRPLRGRP